MDNTYQMNRNNNKNILIIYGMIFSLILIPNIKLGGIPAFRVEQIIVTLVTLYAFIKVLSGKNINIKNSLFVFMYIGLSFLIFISILIGSFKGIVVIPSDFFEMYKIFIYLNTYIITTKIVTSNEDRIKVVKFTIFCLLIAS